MSREPKHYSIFQPDNDSADRWILILETPRPAQNGPDYRIGIQVGNFIGVFTSRRLALEFASDFDDNVSSAQRWCLIGVYENPCLSVVMSNIDREQLQ